jgi:hypothetical protein
MAYGVIYGITGNFKLCPNRTRLPIDRIDHADDMGIGDRESTFVLKTIGLHKIDMTINLLAPAISIPITVELWNMTRNALVQRRSSCVPNHTAPFDKHFSFDVVNPGVADEYAFFITPEARGSVNEFKLFTQELNFHAVVQMFGGGGVTGDGVPNAILKWAGPHRAADSIMSEVGRVIKVAGAVSLEGGPNNATFMGMSDGQNTPPAPTNQCRFRYNANTQRPEVSYNGGPYADLIPLETLILPVGDEATPLSAGQAWASFRMPYNMRLESVRASVSKAPAKAPLKIDIRQNGTSILKGPAVIEAGAKSTAKSAVQPQVLNTRLVDDAEIVVDVCSVGEGESGLKVYLLGRRI